jgi:hypothetical protein
LGASGETWRTETKGMPTSRSFGSKQCNAAWSATGPWITVRPSSSLVRLSPSNQADQRDPRCPLTRTSYCGMPLRSAGEVSLAHLAREIVRHLDHPPSEQVGGGGSHHGKNQRAIYSADTWHVDDGTGSDGGPRYHKAPVRRVLTADYQAGHPGRVRPGHGEGVLSGARDGVVTFVVDREGHLRFGPRRFEHVSLSRGEPVRAAGELRLERRAEGLVATDISNQSTGYCPDASGWEAVSAALDALKVARPDGWTTVFQFRTCPNCGEINVVKDDCLVCGVCEADLPEA